MKYLCINDYDNRNNKTKNKNKNKKKFKSKFLNKYNFNTIIKHNNNNNNNIYDYDYDYYYDYDYDYDYDYHNHYHKYYYKYYLKKSNSYKYMFFSTLHNNDNIKFIDKRNPIDQIIIKNISIDIKLCFKKNSNHFSTFHCFDERIHNIFDYNYFNNFLWYDSQHNFYKTIDSLTISYYITYIANTIDMCSKEIITAYVILHSIVDSHNYDIIKTYTFRILWLAICNLSIKLLSDDYELSFKWITNQFKEKIVGLNIDILLKIEYNLLNILNYKLPQGQIYTIISNKLLYDTSYNFNIFD
tara:strand:+ start:251 stop:1147 length:897 start_codon:yes stop_codon:yes gene_type:complete